MAKGSNFVCQQCGYAQVGWAGKCPSCGAWNSLVETLVNSEKRTTSGKSVRQVVGSSEAVKLSSIPLKLTGRTSTKLSELDRVLGGGMVSGQVILIAGEPGIGKSTLLLQLADNITNTIYVSGEESATQVRIRADRLSVKNKAVLFLEETDIDQIVEIVSAAQGGTVADEKLKDKASRPSLVIVDSIQTMQTGDLTGLPGSVGQVRECAYRLVRIAKRLGITVIIVGHVTKQGTVAGPAVLAHIVDTVLWFEGEQSLSLRVLRSVKNRFGPTDEVGIFSMEEKGLVSESDPQKLFLSDSKVRASGSVASSILQGTRPILVEIQSLVVPTKLPIPRRNAQGIDPRRFEMLLAVLTRRSGIPLYDQDVLVNVAGGIKAYDPGVDLAVCLSVVSAFYDKVLPAKLLAIGEVGLLGEIRPTIMQEKRIKEAKRLGFKDVASPQTFKFLSQAIKSYLK